MTEVEDIFAELGLSLYLHDFLEQGFDTWYSILDIKESDFDALNVKLGHRRKLQRKIAKSKGWSSDRALETPGHTPNNNCHSVDQKAGGIKADAKDSRIQGAKRKYRRHPKSDKNAPERPPSAYVTFSNKIREENEVKRLSFTVITKLVGESWQRLSPSEKEPYKQQAFTTKERYNNEVVEYKKTERYRKHAQYLAGFKARQSIHQPVIDLGSSRRPKLKAPQSTVRNRTACSRDSQQAFNPPSFQQAKSMSHITYWPNGDGHVLSPRSSNMPKLDVSIKVPKRQGLPNTTLSAVLPGYRESILRRGSSIASVERRPPKSTPSLQQSL